jgi:hypothetical protein
VISADGSNDAPVERAESADYDLLTFSEVAARLVELAAAEKDELARLRRATRPDPARVRQLEERIALLASLEARYRDQAETNEVFTRRFGSKPFATLPDARPPRWV